MDGGTVYNVDAKDAVLGCMDLGYAEEDIVVDVVVCGQRHIKEEDEKRTRDAAFNFERAFSLRRYGVGMNSHLEAMRAYPNANWRNYVDEIDPLYPNAVDFRNSTTWPI